MDLLKLVLDSKTTDNLNLIQSSLGYKARSNMERKIAKKMDALGNLALAAYRSKVPIDTGLLRDSNIQKSPRTFVRSSKELTIYITGSHTGRRGNTMPASVLAEILDNGFSERGFPYRRTRTSSSVPPFTSIARRLPTAGWILSARNAFNAARRGLS